ncbi:MFS transporter prlL [Pseudocercospora fuligena]|uniref:MFS transporter prlL n=1 Tax=Pseudocercospora fuligena TaxID=685502 RepID=A0A8H6VF39_9PEZI|nr:MFS transporter prlL [Pseudocercospora fuligena]
MTPTESISEDTKANEKAAYRKADIRILLWYSFVYLTMRIHVSNITNTAIINVEEGDGIKKQLGNLTSGQWAWVLSIFYYPYMFFEPTSTMLLKHFSPRIWMSRIMITWGIISMCQGATQNYGGMLAARFFLGLAEAGYYPGVLYHLSFWYPAKSTALRIALFYASGQFSGTISGLLAYAISFMNGAGGLAGWRWVFILEGIPAILCGIYTYFMLPNYPETSSFVTEEEQHIILERLPKTQPTSNAKTWNFDQIKTVFRDPTTLTFTLTWICHAIGGWGVSQVLPIVIYELGFTDSANSQLLTMPTYAFACICLVGIGWSIQRRILNPWTAAISLEILACICYIILICVRNSIAKYILIMIATSCSICIYPILWPERIRAAHGTTAAGLTIGLTNAAAQMTGIVGPQVYQSRFGPTYKVSYEISIGLLVGAVASIGVTWWLIRRRDLVVEETEEERVDGEVMRKR